jgi:hypothetical protein
LEYSLVGLCSKITRAPIEEIIMSTSVTPSADTPLIAVIGAIGNQYSSVIDALFDRGARMRSLIGDAGTQAATALADRGVEPRVGDPDNDAHLEALFTSRRRPHDDHPLLRGIGHESATGWNPAS